MNNQMNSAVRKIHNLLSSGAVTVTGPNQPRILKQKVGGTTVTPTNNLQHHVGGSANRCYVCDEALGASQAQHQLTEMQTSHTSTKFPNKIGQLVGDAFMVIVSVEDVVCSRCTNLINYLDRLENDVERVRTNLMNLLHKKYGLNDDGGGVATASPPIKMQKLNSGSAARVGGDDAASELSRTRKLLHASDSTLGKQSPPVSAVQQIKISTPAVQQSTAGTQTLQRKTTRIYKCQSCDYKTSDMRLFNTHYETCKHQNFQCKNCKKIFPNFGAMKQHMVREHNMPMDNTCSVCHYNYMNEPALRKHMEMTHSTSVVVTSTTTTLPAEQQLSSGATTTSLYTCNHCQFKSTDKTIFDEHLRKHLSGAKPKPFKCRLCAQRFETRDAATVHAKQHQPNYFKCGTCSMSFPKRELLVKHFEVHQQQQHTATSSAATVTHSQQQQITTTTTLSSAGHQQTQNVLTTQKLLQESIDEALNDNVVTSAAQTATAVAPDVAAAAANNIRFFSCHLCSLTFLQDHYYNQHMDTHRREKKSGTASSSGTGGANSSSIDSAAGLVSSLATLNSAAALLGDGLSKDDGDEAGDDAGGAGGDGGAQHANLGADIESIFEKMHSDKGDAASSGAGEHTTATVAVSNATGANSAGSAAQGDNLVITQEGGITFNITIPQPGVADRQQDSANAKATAPVSVSIDMPVLDQPDDMGGGKSVSDAAKASSAGPVSMPSLDDDNETQEHHSHDGDTSEGATAAGEAGPPADAAMKKDAADGELKSEAERSADGSKDEEGSGESGDGAGSAGGSNAAADTDEQNATGAAAAAAAKTAASSSAGGAAIAEGGSEAEAATPEQLVSGASAGGEHHPQQVAMELDEAMQAQVESGHIKFILNENGQLLQLDNHIITDADGNQILVQDPEQIQQLLQSVGVLQSGDGLDGETLQMMTDANGQMVLVQGENNETQLIDASLLNADGQLVIQQGQDGDMGTHVIGEDGTRIPVSVSYTADGQPIVQVQQQVLHEPGDGADAHDVVLQKTDEEEEEPTGAGSQCGGEDGDGSQDGGDAASGSGGGTADAGSGGGGGFFALDELMQQSSEAKVASAE